MPSGPLPRGDGRGGGGVQLHQGDEQGSAEGDLQDGDLHDTQLPRGSDLRGGRAEPTAGGRVLHVDGLTDRRHRHRRHRGGCAGPPRARLPRGRDRRGARPGPRRVLLLAPRRGIPHVEPGHHREAAIRQQDQRRRRVPRFRGARQRLRAPPLHTAGLARFQDPGPSPFRFTRSSPPSKSSNGSQRAQSPSAPSAARRTNRWQSR